MTAPKWVTAGLLWGAPALDKQAVPSGTASASKGSAASESTDSTSEQVAGSRAVSTSKNPSGFVAGGDQFSSVNPRGFLAGGHPSVAGISTGSTAAVVASDGQHARVPQACLGRTLACSGPMEPRACLGRSIARSVPMEPRPCPG